MKKVILILLVVLFFIPLSVSAQTSKHAIIVAYNGSGPYKIWATTCGRLFKDVLMEYGYSQKEITLIFGKKATPENIENAINELKYVDEFIIGFFGHGSSTSIGLHDSCIYHTELKELLSGLTSQKQLVVIDTCGSAGAIIEGWDGITLNAENRLILTSTKFEKETSVFSGHLTDWSRAVLKYGLLEGRADFNGDGKVSVEEAGSIKGGMSDGYGEEFLL